MKGLEVYRKGNKVVLAGKVKQIVSGKTKNSGKEYVRLVLQKKAMTWDPELEMEVEAEEAEEATIIFVDNEEGFYGPSLAATNVEKLKIKDGTYVAVKASAKENDDGTISYFGSRVQYLGCCFDFKFSEDGPAASVIIGTTIVKSQTEVSVPVRSYDFKKRVQYTAWANMTAAEGVSVEEGTFDQTEDGKNPYVAFVIPKFDKTQNSDGDDQSWTGSFISCKRVS